MNNKAVKKICAVLLSVIMCITLLSLSAFSLSLDEKGSITLHASDYASGEPIDSLTFRLYFFASAYKKADGLGYEYVVPYDDCNMDVSNTEDSYLPVHLSYYAQTHSLPYKEKTTDENGNAVFENLEPGLYLAVFSGSGNNYFVPSPFIANIPHFDKKNSNWSFDVIAKPKMISYLSSDVEGETYISVKKIWKTENEVPESVTVSLLCDYREAAKVTLNESNNWSYRWSNLSKMHSWSVVETQVPDGYSVSYEASENTVTIINTDNSGRPEISVPDEPGTTKPEELIDTGQLNWPVPIFSIVGLILFSIGYAMLNFVKKDEETV